LEGIIIKNKLILIVLAVSVILNVWQFSTSNENVTEEQIELTYSNMLNDVAFLLQEDMTESEFIQLERILEDLSIIAKNTPELDYSNQISNQINDIQILLTSEEHLHVLHLTQGERVELSKIIRETVEKGQIDLLSYNIEQLRN
jgi:hypothetical protein